MEDSSSVKLFDLMIKLQKFSSDYHPVLKTFACALKLRRIIGSLVTEVLQMLDIPDHNCGCI
jgi:hypothetical protein